MKLKPEYLLNLKETLLVVTVLYFYGLAFALHFNAPTYGVDRPAVFLTMGMLFLTALGLEVILAWWEKKGLFIWLLLWVVSYGVIGLYVAPKIFGSWILLYVYFEPIVMVFIGGFAFAYGRVLAEQLFPERVIPREQLHRELIRLPGWNAKDGVLVKTYAFKDFSEALNFVNKAARIAEREHHHPDFNIRFNKVDVRLTSKDEGGIARRDVRMARKIDAVAL